MSNYPFPYDYEPNEPVERISEVRVIRGGMDTWVSFLDEQDIEIGLSGRTYHNPSVSSMRRLAQIVNSGVYAVIVDFGGYRPDIVIRREPEQGV